MNDNSNLNNQFLLNVELRQKKYAVRLLKSKILGMFKSLKLEKIKLLNKLQAINIFKVL